MLQNVRNLSIGQKKTKPFYCCLPSPPSTTTLRSLNCHFPCASLMLKLSCNGCVLFTCKTYKCTTRLTITPNDCALCNLLFKSSTYQHLETNKRGLWWCNKQSFSKKILHHMFNGRRTNNVHDERCWGWPAIVTNEIISIIEEIIQVDRRFKIDGLSLFFTEILLTVLYDIISGDLAYTKVCAM